MNRGVAVNFAGRGLKDSGAHPFCQAEHVDRAVHARLRGLHGIELVVDRRRRARQIVDFVDFYIQRKRHIVTHQLEEVVAQQPLDVLFRAGEEIVDGQNFVAVVDQALAKMRADEARAPGHQDTLPGVIRSRR
jgi:hypothetical protein